MNKKVDPIVERNVDLLRSRSAVGIEKYGTTLAGNKLPLRAWLNHALEETLDNANYLQAAMAEIDSAAGPQVVADEWILPPLPKRVDYREGKTPEYTADQMQTYARAALASATVQAQHSDDAAVDRFATAMKEKLAMSRVKGRGGWDDPAQCSIASLSALLRAHVEKGDPLDVANIAMMIQQRGGSISTPVQAQEPVAWMHQLPHGEYFGPSEEGQGKQFLLSEHDALSEMSAFGGTVSALYPAPVQPVAVPDELLNFSTLITYGILQGSPVPVMGAKFYKKSDVLKLIGSPAAPAAQGDTIEGELTKIVKSGAGKDFPGFLEWIADRLVYVHKENNNVDYVQTLRTRAKQLRAAIAAKAAS